MSDDTILVTGDRGFVARYVITNLLENEYSVVGIDNGDKHGQPELPYDDKLKDRVVGDCRNTSLLWELIEKNDVDKVIAAGALIGGISYFHRFPSDIIDTNNEITASTIEACVETDIDHLVMVSSSMVYESASEFPVEEGQELEIPPPKTAYGFQKLSTEYSVRAAKDQYDLDYTIVRPFNAVGAGEKMDPEEKGFAHVIPDFIYEAKNVDLGEGEKFSILGDGSQIRSFTHASDIARGIRMCLESSEARNEDFNFVTHESIEMKNLAKEIWSKVRNEDFPGFEYREAFENDVQVRDGCHDKAKDRLGWTPSYDRDGILDDIIEFLEKDTVNYGG